MKHRAAVAAIGLTALVALSACQQGSQTTPDTGSARPVTPQASASLADAPAPTPSAEAMAAVTNPDARGLVDAIVASRQAAQQGGMSMKLSAIEDLGIGAVAMCVATSSKLGEDGMVSMSGTTGVGAAAGTDPLAACQAEPATTIDQIIIGSKAWVSANGGQYHAATLSEAAQAEAATSIEVENSGTAYASLFNDPKKFTKKDATTYVVTLDDPGDLAGLSAVMGSAGSAFDSSLEVVDTLDGTLTLTTADGKLASGVVLLTMTAQGQSMSISEVATYDDTPVKDIEPPSNVASGAPTSVDSLAELGTLVTSDMQGSGE